MYFFIIIIIIIIFGGDLNSQYPLAWSLCKICTCKFKKYLGTHVSSQFLKEERKGNLKKEINWILNAGIKFFIKLYFE